MARKTIKRTVLIEKLNMALRSEHLSDKEKQVIATFTETVLITSKAYEGYTIPEPGANISQQTYL